MEASLNPYEPFARAVLFLSLTLLGGVPLGLAFAVRPILRREGIAMEPLWLRAQRVLRVAALGVLLGGLGLFLAQVIPQEFEFTSAEWVKFIRQTTLGQMMLTRAGLGVLALLVLLVVRNQRVWLIAAPLIAVLAQASITRTSHSLAMQIGSVAIAADFLHLLAGALWLGGLVALLMAMPLILDLADESQVTHAAAALIRRFSPLGILGVGLAAGTGVWLTAQHIEGTSILMGSLYGNMIVLKVLGTLVAMALAAVHKFVTQRRMHGRAEVLRFVRTLRVETWVVVAVFACAAVLTSTTPSGQMMHTPRPDELTFMATTTFYRVLVLGAIGIVLATGLALTLELRRRTQFTEHIKSP